MKVLWAPWRGEYITSEKDGRCIFCRVSEENNDEKNYVFARKRDVFGMLNKFPYSSGHLMIAPYRHVTDIGDLEEAEWVGMLELAKVSVKVLKDLMHPDGLNLGINSGDASGAGFEHLHLHLVPRWKGDTNFMPVLAETKVISEHLDAVYGKITDRLKSE